MNKKEKTIVLIIILCIVTIILLIFFIKILNQSVGNYKDDNIISYEDIFYDRLNNIRIDAKMADINIKVSDNNISKVTVYDKNDTEVKVIDNNLIINSNTKRCRYICFNIKKPTIEISLPKDFKNLIKINGEYGNIKIGEFDFGEYNIDLELGKIDIVSGLNIKIDNEMGVTNITNVYNKIEAKNELGDIKIKNLLIREDSIIENELGKIVINNTSDIYIDAKTELGKININKNNRYSNVVLTLKNDMGNINVKN